MGAPVLDSLRRGREGEREEGKRGRSEASTNKREREREREKKKLEKDLTIIIIINKNKIQVNNAKDRMIDSNSITALVSLYRQVGFSSISKDSFTHLSTRIV